VCSSYGRWIQLDARSNLFLLVAVLDNVQGRGVLQIDTLSAEQVDTDKLREPKTDTDWSPVDLRFPAKALQANESIVVPLQIELRPEKIGFNTAESSAVFEQIRSLRKTIASKDEKGKVLFKKSIKAFKEPQYPRPKTYTYGPRMRLIHAVSDGRIVKLRDYVPSAVVMYFGFDGASCPALYVKVPDEVEKRSYGRILVGAVGRKRTETFVHNGPVQFIEVLEDEPEMTTISSIRTYIEGSSGEMMLVDQQRNVIVLPGRALRIENRALRQAKRIVIEVEGFYESFPSLLLNANAGSPSLPASSIPRGSNASPASVHE